MRCVCRDIVKEIIGGSRRVIEFEVFDDRGAPFPLSTFWGRFILFSAINRDMSPVVSKSMQIDQSKTNLISVVLGAKDTLDLNGKYIYQIMLYNDVGIADTINQGEIIIYKNYAKDDILEVWS